MSQPGGRLLHTGVFALEDDYDEALTGMGGTGEARSRPRLIVTAVDLGEGLVLRCPHCNTVHPCGRPLGRPCETCGVAHDVEDWRGRDIACTNPSCGGPLRVNEFVVERH